MGREFKGLADKVDGPPHNEFAGPPAAVAFQELLEGHRLVPGFVGFRRPEDLIEGVEEAVSDSVELSGGALS